MNSPKENLLLFYDDIRFKNGTDGFIPALIIIAAFVSICIGFMISAAAGFACLFFVYMIINFISNYRREKKISELEHTTKKLEGIIEDDRSKIHKLSRSKADVDFNKAYKEIENQ